MNEMEYESPRNLNDFINTYTASVVPILSEVENKRKKLVLKYSSIVFILLLVFALSIIPAFIFLPKLAPVLMVLYEPFVLLILATLFCRFRTEYTNKAKKLIKENVFPKLFENYPNIKWFGHNPNILSEENLKLSNAKIIRSRLFYDNFVRFTDDEFFGSYEGIEFEVSEIKLCDELKSQIRIYEPFRSIFELVAGNEIDIDQGGDFTNQLFKGIIFHFKLPKKWVNKSIITTKSLTKSNAVALIFGTFSYLLFLAFFFENRFFHNIIFISSIICGLLGFIAVKIFFIILNRQPRKSIKKTISSRDYYIRKEEVGYHFIEQLYKLEKHFKSKELQCSIQDNDITIAIQTKRNIFEIGDLFQSPKELKSIINVYKDISAIYDFMDYIKNNEDLN